MPFLGIPTSRKDLGHAGWVKGAATVGARTAGNLAELAGQDSTAGRYRYFADAVDDPRMGYAGTINPINVLDLKNNGRGGSGAYQFTTMQPVATTSNKKTGHKNNNNNNNNNNDGDGSGYTAPAKVLDTAQLQSLDSLIQRLGTIKDQVIQKATLMRDSHLNEKAQEKKEQEDQYKSKKLTTLQDFASAKTDTDLGTRNTLENLISSLSVLGLGGSRALTRQILDAANMSNRKANATQARNNQELDSSWNNYTAGYNNDVKKINDQYGYDTGEANRQYLEDKQNALYKKADVYNAVDDKAHHDAMLHEGDGLNDMIAKSAFMNPQYTGKKRVMATPELGTYTQDIAKYDTTGVGADGAIVPGGVTGASDGMSTPGNLAVRAIAVNNKDLGVKKKPEGELGYGV